MKKIGTGRMKQFFAMLLAAVMLLSLAACGSKKSSKDTSSTQSAQESAADESDLILPYSREDGVNPFSATSLMNQSVMPLLYDGLVKIDSTYKPSAAIGKSCTVSGTSLTVQLDTARTFSDGTAISADDVVYSFNKAKDSTYYSTALAGISSVETSGQDAVVFKLKEANQYAAADLTFPIVKSDSADDSSSIPVGAGQYVYSASERGGVLKQNKKYGADTYKSKQIYLSNTTGSDSLLYSLGIGNINATFDDLSGGSLQRVTASLSQVSLNNLVMISIRQSGKLADAAIRADLSDLLNRTDLISAGMDGYADASKLPFNPSWYASADVKVSAGKKEAEKKAVSEAFKGDTLTIVTDKDNSFKVKTANELAEQLKSLGVTATVSSLSYSAYSSAVSAGSYDLSIAEYKLTNDMDISDYLEDDDLLKTYQSMLAGTTTCSKFVSAFNKEMPFITIGFRSGVLAYSRSMTAEAKPLPENPYANISEWTFS